MEVDPKITMRMQKSNGEQRNRSQDMRLGCFIADDLLISYQSLAPSLLVCGHIRAAVDGGCGNRAKANAVLPPIAMATPLFFERLRKRICAADVRGPVPSTTDWELLKDGVEGREMLMMWREQQCNMSGVCRMQTRERQSC